MLLGEILVQQRKIDHSQLESAMRLQREMGTQIGEALVELGAATPADVAEALREQSTRPTSDADTPRD